MEFHNKLLYMKGKSSPWGKIQDQWWVTPWLVGVSTSGHGGYKLPREWNSKIPQIMRIKGGWYEEDCEWSIVFSVLENQIKRDMFNFKDSNTCSYNTMFNELYHVKCFRNYFPYAYESFFEVNLEEGESILKDQDTWRERNKDKWQSISAINLPNSNNARVFVSIGGNREAGNKEKMIIFPRDFYDSKYTPFGRCFSSEEIERFSNIQV